MIRPKYRIKKALILFFKIIIGVLGSSIILILFPILNVRIGLLKSSRIGHYIIETELAILQSNKSKKCSKRIYFDIWFENRIISNSFIQQYWRNQLRVWDKNLMAPIYTVMKFIQMPKCFFIETLHGDRDTTDELIRAVPPIFFKDAEKNILRKIMSDLGLPFDAKFVCFHNRDAEYLKNLYPGEDYSYHSYRDTSLSKYLNGLDKLTERGYYIIRMGSSTKDKIPKDFNPKIIDYANSEIQCDTLDVFLISECEYFISNSSGIDTLATLLKKPILFLNFPNFSYIATWQPNTMYSFKDYLKKKNFEKMNLQYIFDNNFYGFLKSEDFEFNNIILKENSSEDNLNYMIEFDDALKSGKLSDLETLPELEIKFWEIFPFSKILHPGSVHRCRISQLYLRKMNQIN